MSGYCFLASNPPALQAAKVFLRKNRDHESGRFTDLPEEMNGGSHAQAKSSSNMPWSGNKLICGGDSSWCCSSFISLIRSYYHWSILGPWKCCVALQGFDPKKKQTLLHWQTFFQCLPRWSFRLMPSNSPEYPLQTINFEHPCINIWWNKPIFIHALGRKTWILRRFERL